MKINLAPLKFRRIHAKFNGPIEKISIKEKNIRLGEPGFEVYTYLKKSLLPNKEIKYQIYGNAQGTGSSKYKHIAVYTAITEAIERWAYYFSCNSYLASPYGFDIDNSTAGMAGFSGLTKQHARHIAYYEATERWALREWDAGRVKGIPFDYRKEDAYSGLELQSPFYTSKVALIWRKHPELDFYAYGFACDKNLSLAAKKAEIEQYRNELLLENKIKTGELTDLKKAIETLQLQSEKRLLHFATKNGFNLFQDKVAASTKLNSNTKTPLIIVDTEIIGSWSKYTTIWRVLFEPNEDLSKNNEINTFYF